MRMIAVLLPVERIVDDVGTNLVQRVLIADDVIVEAALPAEFCEAGSVYAFRTDGLNLTDDGPQRSRLQPVCRDASPRRLPLVRLLP